MSRRIIVVGSGGFIGSRLCAELSKRKIQHWEVDLGIYTRLLDWEGDVTTMDPKEFKDAVVIYLACFHRDPAVLRIGLDGAYTKLMVHTPVEIAERCFSLIYVSSMLAITDQDSLYASVKRYAERKLCDRALILRPGTVWGGLSPDLPNRTSTALNYALTRGKFEGDHWTFFTTHMTLLLEQLMFHAQFLADEERAPTRHHQNSGEIRNIVDLSTPLTSDDVRALIDGNFHDAPMQSLFNLEYSRIRVTHPGLDLELDLEEDVRAEKRLLEYWEGK